MAELGITQDPLAYNVRYEFLTGESVQKTYQLAFGEKKPLIDWFLNENEN